jgi:NAD(P)-dependent dehydrogenase (short-subunit alcohol dehydrogenase family)
MALAFARDGADVGINYLDDRAAAESVAEGVRAVGVRAVLVQADVARLEQIEAMVMEVAQALGGLDVLVNNAGVYPRVSFLEMRERDWDHVLGVNLKASCFCAQAAARAMIAGGRRGVIVNLASQAIRGAPRGVHYSASKGGVVAMTRAMALELAPHGIRVNAIGPGFIETPMTAPLRANEARTGWAMGMTPMGRFGTPEEIANTALFLASDEASFFTGELLHPSGGVFVG